MADPGSRLSLRPRDCLVYGGTPFRDPKSSVQKQMARHLAAQGGKVIYAEVAPSPPGPADILEECGSIHIVTLRRTPGLPMTVPGWNRRINMRLNRKPLAALAAKLGLRDFVMIHYGWFSAELAGSLGQGLDVLECIDADEERPRILRFPGLRDYVMRTERRLLARIDGLVVTSPALLQSRVRAGLPHIVLPNAVDSGTFAPGSAEPEGLRSIPRPRLVLAGVLGEKIDLELVSEALDRNPGTQLVVLGPVQRRVPLGLAGARAHFLGAMSHEALAAHLEHCDAGLIPLTETKYNRGSCPLKALEYLASGLPSVSVANPAVESLAAEHPEMFFVAPERSRFAGLVPRALDAVAASGFRDRARRAASVHSWDRRAAGLLDFVNSLPEARRRPDRAGAS